MPSKTELENAVGELLVTKLRGLDVGYMIADLKEIFAEDEGEFKKLVEVLKESLGEFLMDVYASNEEHVTVEDLFVRLKDIINRRIDEA